MVPAVRECSLSLDDGEFLVLAGPSGCGKTTLLRLVAGLETPDDGVVTFDGMRMNEVPPEDRDVAMVFQDHALFPQLNVQDNLALGLELRHVPRAEIRRRVQETAEWLGISEALDRFPESLSGGERQRVALGRALVRRPRVLLLDEPWSNLDLPLRAQVRGEVLGWHERLRMTTIYVTHDQAEALPLASRLAVMRPGCLDQVGSPLQVYAQPASLFVATFLGSPPVQCLPGQLLAEGERLVLVPRALPETRLAGPTLSAAEAQRWAGQAVVAGIRPEEIEIAGTGSASAGGLRGVLERTEFAAGGFLVTIRLGRDLPVVARRVTVPPWEAGQVGEVRWEPDRVHWFDSSSGRRFSGPK